MNDAHFGSDRIRRATVEDAAAIAEVHIRSWQWAYRGLLPDEYLDSLDETLDRRLRMWTATLANDEAARLVWVTETAGRVVGFVSGGSSRDEDATPETGEIGAIYLLREVAGEGRGRELLARVTSELRRCGYRRATLWVLATNTRARRFYEAAGWQPDGATKVEERPGVTLHEVRYRTHL